MKREGRQHGVVRSYPILPTSFSRQRRYVKTVDSTSVAGVFAKVSRKPTNQSKFTGKCGNARCFGCHIHPVCKSRDKAKGTRKLRSIGSDHRELIGCPAGTSAIDAITYLASHENYDDGTIEDYDCSDDDDAKEQIGVEDNADDGWFLVGHFQ
ncbi:hypothetical protein Hdeb2414_s0023g00632081 [Helianthus debilis subsp. tardiflorus]